MTNELKYILSENIKLKSEYQDIEKYTECCQTLKDGVINYCNQLKIKLNNFVQTVKHNF